MKAAIKSRKLVYLVAAILVSLAILIIVATVNTGPKVPNVKFVDFTPDGTATIKQGQQVAIKFNIENNENYQILNASARTSFDGAPQYFLVDKQVITLTNPIGAEKGRSGQQTVTVTGMTSDQQAVESNFTVSLYVGSDVTDSKIFKLRLER